MIDDIKTPILHKPDYAAIKRDAPQWNNQITDEMIEAGAIAIANAAGSIITEFKGQSADFTELRRKQSKACLEAAEKVRTL